MAGRRAGAGRAAQHAEPEPGRPHQEHRRRQGHGRPTEGGQEPRLQRRLPTGQQLRRRRAEEGRRPPRHHRPPGRQQQHVAGVSGQVHACRRQAQQRPTGDGVGRRPRPAAAGQGPAQPPGGQGQDQPVGHPRHRLGGRRPSRRRFGRSARRARRDAGHDRRR